MKTLYLPDELRPELRKVWGIPILGKKKEIAKKYKKLIKERKFKKIITIGDCCSLSLSSDIKIFDGKINRKKIKKSLPFSLNCSNPPGTIQEKVWPIIKKAIKENKNVFIDGEEDLLVIPAVLLSEKHSAVVYGFFDKGICLIEVSEKTKKTFKELLKKFKHSS
ncbi:MAG: DUF359 domain-containing protein [Candidatus Nealsonbacteria bacterium]